MNKDLESLKADRPDIITTEIEAIHFYRKMDTAATVDAMIAGKYVLVEEFYSNGLQVLNELKRNLLLKHTDKSIQGQREYRNAFKEASHRLLLKVKDNKLIVKKGPDFAWLELLYPDVSEFYVSFPDVQGMNSSWQWYQKGLEVKTLDLKIHPYYDTYFPTRFDHLKLFDKWLKKYDGPKENAIDIGVGSGVLSFQLLQNGFKNIFATDINKNAIIGVAEENKRLGFEDKITLNHGDLFDNCDVKADVIVFNPPWLLAKHSPEVEIDKARYYEEDLFPRFFEQAEKHLTPEGKIVLIFSSLVQVDDEESVHPIIEELQKNNRFKKELHLRRDVRASSRRTKRRDSSDTEKVELWVLAPKTK
jgi:methylase of polypeptide subunit release factors